MSVTTKIKLIPADGQHQILKETMIRFNEACHYISQIAFEHKTYGQVKVHKLCYHYVREKFGLYRADQKPGKAQSTFL
jgi:predicted transposase